MRVLCLFLSLLAASSSAETWADEASEPLRPVLERPPLLGLVAGLQLGSTFFSNGAPVPGARLGVRLRLADHVCLGAVAVYEQETYSGVSDSFSDPTRFALATGHLFYGLLVLELFTVSAFAHLLVPELSVGLFGGAGVGVDSLGGFAVSGLGGVHLGLSRLRPSGWWFPFFVEVGLESTTWRDPTYGLTPSTAHWRFAAGVGL